MIINFYKKIKSRNLKNILLVKLTSFNKKIFSLKTSLIKTSFTDKRIDNYLQKNFLPSINFEKKDCAKTADLALKNCFKILGQTINFKNKINWHNPHIHSNKKIKEWKTLNYQKIKIKINNSNKQNKFTSDIKVPWELSRMQHIPSLAIAQKTEIYIKHINSWIDNNPFLKGVNWVCPMDVAIRAINLIYGFYLSNNTLNTRFKFKKKLIRSLYEHAIYLENNFEIFYKPNNHYIADLIGYFYLCFFFDDIKHFQEAKKRTYKKILKQFDLQIQSDGSSYEGSSGYHKLVTEMFLHFCMLCKKNNISLPTSFNEKLNKAVQLIKNLYDNYGNFIQIGDNDSGYILKNTINTNFRSRTNIISHYPNFGLSIIKNNIWHITYRHPTYNKKQPTGHFHQDDLSVTISYRGVPILVDPGSYVYTSNKLWRNLMRSYKSHNTFYIDNKNIGLKDIFALKKEIQTDTSLIKKIKNQITIKNFTIHKSIKAHRELIYNNSKITLIDTWEKNICEKKSHWNFIFNPKINIKKINKNKFEILYKNKKILYLKSNLNLKEKSCYYSSEYGKIEPSKKLEGLEKISCKKYTTVLYTAKT